MATPQISTITLNVTTNSINGTLYNATPYPPNSSRHKEITAPITYHLAKDMAQINSVQHEGFRNMINTLNKWYSMPSHNYFSNISLPDMYNKEWAVVEAEMQEIDNFSTPVEP